MTFKNLDLKKDIDKIVENFEEKHKDNLGSAIFECHWEPKFESNASRPASSLGKPLGVLLSCWLAVRLRMCALPPGMGWGDTLLAGLLAGIGFTMAIFIATLAFDSEALLNAAKLGVLMASATAAVLGLAWGLVLRRRHAAAATAQPA